MIHLEITADSAQEFTDQLQALVPLIGAAPAAEPDKKPRRTTRKKTEKVAETAEAQPEEGKDEAVETTDDSDALDPDAVKRFVINDYLNACFDNQKERSEAFKKLLSEFDSEKFGDIPVERMADVQKRAEELIAKHAKKAA